MTEFCAEGELSKKTHIYVEHCHETEGNQAFIIDEVRKFIV